MASKTFALFVVDAMLWLKYPYFCYYSAQCLKLYTIYLEWFGFSERNKMPKSSTTFVSIRAIRCPQPHAHIHKLSLSLSLSPSFGYGGECVSSGFSRLCLSQWPYNASNTIRYSITMLMLNQNAGELRMCTVDFPCIRVHRLLFVCLKWKGCSERRTKCILKLEF